MDLQEETCIVAAQINELKSKAIAVGILANSLEMSSRCCSKNQEAIEIHTKLDIHAGREIGRGRETDGCTKSTEPPGQACVVGCVGVWCVLSIGNIHFKGPNTIFLPKLRL